MKATKKKAKSPKEMAIAIMAADSPERKEAEKMMGCSVFQMTKEQIWLTAICLAAFSRE